MRTITRTSLGKSDMEEGSRKLPEETATIPELRESKLRMERIIGQGVKVRFGLTCPFLRPACESIPSHDATTCHRENGGPQRLTAMVQQIQTVAPDGRFPTNSHDEQRLQR
ncbi:hypothetical protein XPA_006137 [Xanthoria parietina]